MLLLRSIAANNGPISLNDLSVRTDLHPSKIHRYLASLVHTGMLEKTAHGRYDLGPYLLELGTGYLSRLDPTSTAAPVMENLRDQTGEGIILNVWGDSGTTVIRWFQSRQPISVSIRPGATFLTTMSASGRVFLSYLPRETTRAVVERELAELNRNHHPQAPKTISDLDPVIEETRAHGLARVDGHSVQGVSAMAAPIFDYRGEIALTLVLFGFSSTFDDAWDGENAELLRNSALSISRQLGFIDDTG